MSPSRRVRENCRLRRAGTRALQFGTYSSQEGFIRFKDRNVGRDRPRAQSAAPARLRRLSEKEEKNQLWKKEWGPRTENKSFQIERGHRKARPHKGFQKGPGVRARRFGRKAFHLKTASSNCRSFSGCAAWRRAPRSTSSTASSTSTGRDIESVSTHFVNVFILHVFHTPPFESFLKERKKLKRS